MGMGVGYGVWAGLQGWGRGYCEGAGLWVDWSGEVGGAKDGAWL